MSSIKNVDVAAVFDSYPAKSRRKLLALRRLVLKTAELTDGVGKIEETLKWGEPAYPTPETKSGSTIRIAWKHSKQNQYAIYFNCQTNLVPSFRELFSDVFSFEGNRAIVFDVTEPSGSFVSGCTSRCVLVSDRARERLFWRALSYGRPRTCSPPCTSTRAS